jgi:hypothetical protein
MKSILGKIYIPLVIVILLAKTNNVFGNQQKPANIIGWWPAEGNMSDIVSEINGTVKNGGAFSNGFIDQALDLDGYDDIVTVPDNSTLDFGAGQDFTIEAWLYLRNYSNTGDSWIFSKWDVQNYRVGFTNNLFAVYINRNDHSLRFDLHSNRVAYLGHGSPFPIGKWVHLAVVRNGNTASIYLNGQLDASWTATSGSIANNDPFVIGHVLDGLGTQFNQGFNGLIDEVSVYDRALSPQEIQAIANQSPIADAGQNIVVNSMEVAATVMEGIGTDPDKGDELQYRWLESNTILQGFSPVGSVGRCTLLLAGLALGNGQHSLTLEVTDGKDTASDIMILTIENTSPTIAASGGGAFEIGATVSLGGEFSDFDGDLLHYAWTVDGNTSCSGDIRALEGGGPVSITACVVNGLGLGSHIATIAVSDGNNTPVTANATIQVVDHASPTIAPMANTYILWPPNHQMVDIAISANASDNSGIVHLRASVSSSETIEGLGDGDLAPDWIEPVINESESTVTFKLRSERSGKGNGRVYSVVITASDDSGNSSSSTIDIKVPHSQSKK